MLINQDTEYVIGTPSRRELRKLTGRREDYSLFGKLLRTFAGAIPGFICLLLGVYVLRNEAVVLVGAVSALFGGLLAMTILADIPLTRRLFAIGCRERGELITEDNILFQLVMTDGVKQAIQTGKAEVKSAVDDFFKAVWSNRDLYTFGWPESVPDWLFDVEDRWLKASDLLTRIAESLRAGVSKFQMHVRDFMIEQYGEMIGRERRQRDYCDQQAEAHDERIDWLEERLATVTKCLYV